MNSKQAEAARLKLEQFGRQCQELRERSAKVEAECDRLGGELEHMSASYESAARQRAELRQALKVAREERDALVEKSSVNAINVLAPRV